jgi:hypothetical protein
VPALAHTRPWIEKSSLLQCTSTIVLTARMADGQNSIWSCSGCLLFPAHAIVVRNAHVSIRRTGGTGGAWGKMECSKRPILLHSLNANPRPHLSMPQRDTSALKTNFIFQLPRFQGRHSFHLNQNLLLEAQLTSNADIFLRSYLQRAKLIVHLTATRSTHVPLISPPLHMCIGGL